MKEDMNKAIRIELKLKKRNHLVAIVMQKGTKKHKNKKKESKFNPYDE